MAYSQQIGEVKLEEKVYNIPSYQQNPPNVMPRFYEGKVIRECNAEFILIRLMMD